MKAESIERMLMPVMVIAAIAVAGSAVHREFTVKKVVRPAPDAPPEFVKSWTELESAGVLIGDTAAPIRIVEFADLECPFCKQFQMRLASVRRQLGKNVAVEFIHLPLSVHRFAKPAARALECAGQQGRFGEFVELTYSHQDSLGLMPWASLAHGAGILDTAQYNRCVVSTARMARVEAGIDAASRFNVTATPTVFINGWRYPFPPSDTMMIAAATRLLAGKEPAGKSAAGVAR